MQIREQSALTSDGCREVPAASLARTQNGRGAGLGVRMRGPAVRRRSGRGAPVPDAGRRR